MVVLYNDGPPADKRTKSLDEAGAGGGKAAAGQGADVALKKAESMGSKGGVVLEILLSRARRCEFALHMPQVPPSASMLY